MGSRFSFLIARPCLLVSLLVVLALCAPGLGAVAEASFAGFSRPAAEPRPESAGAAAPADPADRREIRALRLDDGAGINVDGRLDEPAWAAGQSGSGFRQWDPARGGDASEPTVFKVAYDREAIYFAVACFEIDPSRITKRLARRDRFSNSDLVSVYIDPYRDRTTGYNFRVNPLGVQEDSYVFADGNMDRDWDAVWEAETYEDDEGWYAEFRIPFSSIRYHPGESTWGLQIYRYLHGRGEDTAWVVWDRELPGFVSRFGELTGLEGLSAPRQLELLPYVVHRTTDEAVTGPEKADHFENIGLDLKYGLTADLTLNATFQPDFGQVEADPALLNLSPYEVQFQEKRPFFIEGSRSFEHTSFNLFYSRRIGTASEDERIRYAAKITGKTAGDLSIAMLFAATDSTQPGKAHNFLRSGDCPSRYLVGRFGKEFARGDHRLHIMQTAALNSGCRERCGDKGSREAYTTGLDFDFRFRDRLYSVVGSAVGSIIDPEGNPADSMPAPSESYGTGGSLELARRGGSIRGGITGYWASGRLNLNDLGYLRSGDEIRTGLWIYRPYNPEGEARRVNSASLNLNLFKSWLYAGRTGRDLTTGTPAWTYGPGHPRFLSVECNAFVQWRNYMASWFGINGHDEGTQRHETRSTVHLESGDQVAIPGGGPLVSEPATLGGWIGSSTDGRKSFVGEVNFDYFEDTAGNVSRGGNASVNWSQTGAIRHTLSASHNVRTDDTDHLGNFENPGGGIGGVSYVFGRLKQRTVDLTLRTSLLFNRRQSLDLYAQPYVTVGDYSGARELARPDSYDFRPYSAEGFRAGDYDFRYSSVNLNVVYRWEYRPGSALYIVWTQGREGYVDRGSFSGSDRFDNEMSSRSLFRNEPTNTFLAKISYWFPV
ncbi:MAG: carbohydrate binding family 9 domain-containing protein [Candidatus Eisenbacteria bacterium]|nr:carbohydrate binding family 9 domain-containing protein [Candidatus Eisenbacteria bacterium]